MLPVSVGAVAPLQRIRAGKELLEAKRKEEEGAMRRMVEERKREKDEEARARCAAAVCRCSACTTLWPSAYLLAVATEAGGQLQRQEQTDQAGRHHTQPFMRVDNCAVFSTVRHLCVPVLMGTVCGHGMIAT
jgi:hypothetical protein